MSPYPAGAITLPSLTYLLDTPRTGRSNGIIQWTKRGGAYSGRLGVTSSLTECRNVALGVRFALERPSTIHFQYLVNDVPAYRVDINDKHDGWGVCTHAHRYIPADGSEKAIQLDASTFPAVPIDPVIPCGTTLACFKRFAEVVNVELEGTYWTDPHQGWRS